jgi:hypothetical protein
MEAVKVEEVITPVIEEVVLLSDEEVEKLIREACNKCVEKGITVVPGTWGVEWSKKENWHFVDKKAKTCCALSCVILESQEEDPKYKTDFRAWILEEKLQRSFQWLAHFWRGFDGGALEEKVRPKDLEAYQMGERIRTDYTKEKDNE